MGFGSLRDAPSDALFPGTCCMQTRLRYVLLMATPWSWRGGFRRMSRAFRCYNLLVAERRREVLDQHDGQSICAFRRAVAEWAAAEAGDRPYEPDVAWDLVVRRGRRFRTTSASSSRAGRGRSPSLINTMRIQSPRGCVEQIAVERR